MRAFLILLLFITLFPSYAFACPGGVETCDENGENCVRPKCVHAQVEDVSIQSAYSYATAYSQKSGAVFIEIANTSEQDDKLLSASTDVAESAELHTMAHENDVMKMRKVESMDIPANSSVSLQPAGDHIMLIGLKAPLQEGEMFTVDLQFEHAGTVSVPVEVRAAGSVPENNHHDHGHQH